MTKQNYDRQLLENYSKLDGAGKQFIDGMISTWLAAANAYALPDPLPPRSAQQPDSRNPKTKTRV